MSQINYTKGPLEGENHSNGESIFTLNTSSSGSSNKYISARHSLESLGIDEELDLESSQQPEGTSTMRMAFMNMTNSILGAGIIGQPLAMKHTGLVGGLISMVCLTLIIDWTLRLIVINSQLSQTRSYQDTVNFCYGRTGRFVLSATISSFAYGGCVAFCVIIGDTIPHVLKSVLPKAVTNTENSVIGWIFERNVIIVLFTACISYPLSLNRDISKLAKASGFALLGMAIIVLITVVRGPMVDPVLKAPLTKPEIFINKSIFKGLSVISFALVCHHNTIFIYQSIKNASIKKFSKLTHWACAISMCFCLFMGMTGFLNFGHNIKGNILNNFKSDDTWINIARFCFGLNMLTTFPLEIFVVRDVLKDVVLAASPLSSSGSTAHVELSQQQHFIITTILVFSSMSVSLFTCNLGMILELVGATSASLMAYIIPPLCFVKLSWDDVDWKSSTNPEKIRFIVVKVLPCTLCIIFGIMSMLISSYMTIADSYKQKEVSACVND